MAVTFSEKAAGELKLRLREELERARAERRAGGDERRAARARGAALRRGARQHHPRLLRRPAARAAGRGARRPVVRGADRRPGRPALRRGVHRLAAAQLDDPREGVRRSLRRARSRRFGTTTTRTRRSSGSSAPAASCCEWRDHPAPWRRPDGFDRNGADRPSARRHRHVQRDRARRRPTRAIRCSATPSRSGAPGPRCSRCARAASTTTTAGKRRCARWPRGTRDLRTGKSTAGQYSQGVPRAQVVDRARPARGRARRVPRPRRRRPGRAPARGDARCMRALRGAQAARRRARLPRPADPGARLVRDNADVRREFQRASAICWSTSSRTPIRCRPSCCCCWPPTSRRRRRAPRSTCRCARARCSSSAIRSSRSTASAAPTSASIATSATRSSPRGAARVTLQHVVPQRAGDPARRERRVQRAHDRRPRRRCRPTTSRCAGIAPTPDAAGGRRAAGAAPATAITATSRRPRIAASLPERGRRVRALAGARERLHRARRARGRRRPTAASRAGRCAPATSACCSAASSISRTTSRAITSRRSRRAACRTCWSAARRSTSARRWMRSAPR